MAKGDSAEKAIKDIRRKTRRRFSAEEKIRIVMEGMRGEESISTLCRLTTSDHLQTHSRVKKRQRFTL